MQEVVGSSPTSSIERKEARLALDVYLHRLRAAIAAMTASRGGIDALVFTGGVGERSAAVREMAVHGLGFLGLAIGAKRNRVVAGDADLSSTGTPAKTLVIVAREDLEITQQARAVLRDA